MLQFKNVKALQKSRYMQAHMPPYSNQYGEWSSTRYLNWAKKKGPHTYEVIYRLFKDAEVEQKYYRAAHSISSWQIHIPTKD